MPIEDEDPVVAPPLFTTLNADDVKRHLNIVHGQDDRLIGEKLEAAADWVSSYTGLVIEFVEEFEEGQAKLSPRVREAILMLAGHFFNNREAVLVGGVSAEQLPFGLLDMLADYRGWCA